MPLVLVHAVCCGGLVLWPLLGSAGFAVLGSYLEDPLIQAAGILGGVVIGVAAWRRYRAGRPAARVAPPAAHPRREAGVRNVGMPDRAESLGWRLRLALISLTVSALLLVGWVVSPGQVVLSAPEVSSGNAAGPLESGPDQAVRAGPWLPCGC